MEKQQPEIEIIAVRTADLAINPRNARKHSQKQIAQIAASIQEFGVTNPILINGKGRVIAGHGRLLAAKQLGLEVIPAIRLTHLTEAQERALAIADNKITLNSTWDLEILSEELKIMSAPDFEIDVEITGFETPEIDLIVGEPAETGKFDQVDEPVDIDRTKPAVSRLGDLWICGKHRLYCGSALDGALAFISMDWRHMPEILAAGLAAFQEFKNLCVWNKTNGGMGSLYRSKHELVFKTGTAPHINNVELGRYGRYRTNVRDYAGANSFGRNRKSDLETHPTVKPVAMIADAIKDCSHRSGIVLDPFGGSGTTLIAAERTGRRARLIEIDPYYVDAAVNRWARQTAGLPQRVSSVNGASGSDQQEVGAGSETQAGPASLELPPVWLLDWGVVP